MNKKVNRKINTNNGKFPLPDVEVTDRVMSAWYLIWWYSQFQPVSIPECIENQKGKKGVNYGQTPASLLPLQLESLKLGSEQLTPNKSAQLSRFTIKDWLDTARHNLWIIKLKYQPWKVWWSNGSRVLAKYTTSKTVASEGISSCW